MTLLSLRMRDSLSRHIHETTSGDETLTNNQTAIQSSGWEPERLLQFGSLSHRQWFKPLTDLGRLKDAVHHIQYMKSVACVSL